MKGPIKVCMLSCNHSLLDDRIYWKEAFSLQKSGYDVTHIGIGADEQDYVTNEGIHIIQLKKDMDASFLSTILVSSKSIYKKIFTTASALKADVYHIHDWQLNIIGKKLKKLFNKPKIVYDSHDAVSLLLQQNFSDRGFAKKLAAFFYTRLIKGWEKKCVQNYDAVITAERGTESLLKRKRSPIPFLQVYNFSYFEPINRSESSEKKFDLIYCGLIEKTRGIEELLKATQLVKEKIPSFKLLIIGGFSNSSYQKIIEKQIISLQLENNVTLHPAVPFQEIHSFYRQSKAGICCWYLTPKNLHAIPIKIFEYMAFGLPVIFSDRGIATSFIETSNSGVLVNPYSPKDISAAIINLLENDFLYHQLSENGIKAVKEKYHWKYEERKLLALYRQLLSF